MVDQQDKADGKSLERFTHRARRILSTAGVQSGSELRFTFDPACEAVTLHYVRLRRGDTTLDALASTLVARPAPRSPALRR